MPFPKDQLIKEFTYQTSRSSGKGGQHANKVETRVEAYFDVYGSACLTTVQKDRIRKKLNNKLNKLGQLQAYCEATRSQQHNKQEATSKLLHWLERALKTDKPRKKTRPGKAQKEQRLNEKRRQSEKKALRRKDFY